MTEFFWKPLFVGRIVADLRNMEKYLMSEECQDINFTIARPPGLSNNASTGQYDHPVPFGYKLRGQFHHEYITIAVRYDICAQAAEITY